MRKNWAYKPENNTVNSVFDCESNKTTTKKICSKGLKLCSWKVWLNSETDTLFTIFEQICNLLKYVISRPFKLKGDASLCLSQCLWLKVSLGIRWYCFTESNAGIFIYIARPVPNRRYETCKIVFHNRSSYWLGHPVPQTSIGFDSVLGSAISNRR
jgi:hypothetical protein